MTKRVLHLLPHRGGGAETYIDILERMEGWRHGRFALSLGPSPLAGIVSLPVRWPLAALRSRRSDVLHAHGDVAAAIALPLLRNRPSVWTTHGLHFLRRSGKGRRRVTERLVARVVDATAATLCTSAAEKEELVSITGKEHKLVLARNGVTLSPPVDFAQRAASRRDLGLSGNDVAALFVGQLEPRKGPLEAARAALVARERGARVVLLVAGEGSLSGRLQALAGEGIRMLGFRRDIDTLLSAADIFVAPSRREGLSFAVLEAMAHGIACIVSDEPGNREAVGDAGIVIPEGNEAAIAFAIERLARSPEERDRLGAEARRRVESEFPADRLTELVRRAYESALSAAPARGSGVGGASKGGASSMRSPE